MFGTVKIKVENNEDVEEEEDAYVIIKSSAGNDITSLDHSDSNHSSGGLSQLLIKSSNKSKVQLNELEHLSTNSLTESSKPVNKFECKLCFRSFAQKQTLKEHFFKHSGEQPPHKCDVCNKCFGHKSHLTRHRRSHTGEKPHVCGTCGKGFAQLDGLKQHTGIHSREKAEKCSICCRYFASRQFLQRHKRQVHSDKKSSAIFHRNIISQKAWETTTSGIKVVAEDCLIRPYKCDLCEKSYRKRCHMIRHEKSHAVAYDNEQCIIIISDDDDDKDVSVQPQLDNGLNNLEEERSNLDNNSYNAISLLSTNVTHDDVFPFKCDICERLFQRNIELAIHKSTHGSSPGTVVESTLCTLVSDESGLQYYHGNDLSGSYESQNNGCGGNNNDDDNMNSHQVILEASPYNAEVIVI